MVLVGHSRNVERRLSRREKRVMLAVGLTLLAVVVAASVYASVRGDSYSASRDGCVNLTVPSTLGGVTLHRCGAEARVWCTAEEAQSGSLAKLVLAQCALAGLPHASRQPE